MHAITANINEFKPGTQAWIWCRSICCNCSSNYGSWKTCPKCRFPASWQ